MTEAEAKEKRRKRMSELMSGPLIRANQARAEAINPPYDWRTEQREIHAYNKQNKDGHYD